MRDDREAIAARICAERGAVLVKPFDDAGIIAGQGTVGLEIAEDAARIWGSRWTKSWCPAAAAAWSAAWRWG